MKRKKTSKKRTSLFNTATKKKFVVAISSIMAVFVVVSIVGATTTVGLNISTDGNLTVSGNATVTGTTTQTDTVTENGNVNIGDASTDLLTVKAMGRFVNQLQASSTALFGGAVTHYATTTLSGTGADLVVGGTTSTFAGHLLISKDSATSTLHIGKTSNGAGQGGCIALQSDKDGTMLFLIVDATGPTVQLTTSTNPTSCY